MCIKRSKSEKIQILTKKKNEKVLTLQKAESEKSHIIKNIEKLSGKKCPEMDTLRIKLQKKMKSIRHLNYDISRIEDEITLIKSNMK